MTLPLQEIEEIQGKYEILHKIQEGGMGAIYKVRHLLLDEIRAIKVIRPQFSEDQNLRARFTREARAAIKLQHPNIAQLHDFSIDKSGNAYMVMEFIDGVTLRELLSEGGPPQLDLVLEIARQSLQALSYLHQRSYIHRDVAPDNLMLTRDYAGEPLVKLIDLGIIKHLEEGEASLTATGLFLGKVLYAAPEQFSGGDIELTAKADLYSFAVMLYELLTGVYPLAGKNISELIASHLFRPPLAFEETDTDQRVPPDIREAVMRGLEKDPSKRMASAAEFESLLRRDKEPGSLTFVLDQTMATVIPSLADREVLRSDGSTQGRLNDQFGLEPTPGPTDPEPKSTEEMLARARALLDQDKLGEAQRQLYAVLALDPNQRQAREALTETEEALEAAAEAARMRAEAVAVAAAAIDDQIGSERVTQAALRLESAREEFGDTTRFQQLDESLSELRLRLQERAREEAITEHVAAIAEALSQEDVEAASRQLEAVRSEYGNHDSFSELEARLAKLGARLEERALQAAISDSAAAIAAELSHENLDLARQKLAEARSELGENSRFDELGSGVAELQLRLEERAQEAAISAGLATVAEAVRDKNPDEARRRLAKARADHGDEGRFDELGEQIDGLELELARKAQEAALAEIVATAAEHLGAQRLDEAAVELDRARQALGTSEGREELEREIASLHGQLDEQQRKLAEEEAQRQRQALDLLEEEETPAEAEEIEVAAERVEGEHPSAAELLEQAQGDHDTTKVLELLEESRRREPPQQPAVRVGLAAALGVLILAAAGWVVWRQVTSRPDRPPVERTTGVSVMEPPPEIVELQPEAVELQPEVVEPQPEVVEPQPEVVEPRPPSLVTRALLVNALPWAQVTRIWNSETETNYVRPPFPHTPYLAADLPVGEYQVWLERPGESKPLVMTITLEGSSSLTAKELIVDFGIEGKDYLRDAGWQLVD